MTWLREASYANQPSLDPKLLEAQPSCVGSLLGLDLLVNGFCWIVLFAMFAVIYSASCDSSGIYYAAPTSTIMVSTRIPALRATC